jgi:hypothetical protein
MSQPKDNPLESVNNAKRPTRGVVYALGQHFKKYDPLILEDDVHYDSVPDNDNDNGNANDNYNAAYNDKAA